MLRNPKHNFLLLVGPDYFKVAIDIDIEKIMNYCY